MMSYNKDFGLADSFLNYYSDVCKYLDPWDSEPDFSESDSSEPASKQITIKTEPANEYGDEIFGDDPWDSEDSESFYNNLNLNIKTEPQDSDCISDNAQLERECRPQTNKETSLRPTLSCDMIKKDVEANQIGEGRFHSDNDLILQIKQEEVNKDPINDSTSCTENQSTESIKRQAVQQNAYIDGVSTKKQKLSVSSEAQKVGTKNDEIKLLRIVKCEQDPIILARRQKQIDYGKSTIGYDNYIKLIPRNERTGRDPTTPNKDIQYSRRAWDGQIKRWRLHLHHYD